MHRDIKPGNIIIDKSDRSSILERLIFIDPPQRFEFENYSINRDVRRLGPDLPLNEFMIGKSTPFYEVIGVPRMHRP